MAVQIDWETAEVHEGKLVVDLDATPASAWRKSFRATLERVGADDARWGKITTAKAHIAVTSVQEDAAEDLRHLLEGAVMQANADERAEGDDEANETDAALTSAFRAFAG